MSILDDKSMRHQYMANHLRMMISFQVRLIRIQRGWTQAELAKRCATWQSEIARLEDWDAEFPPVQTLQKVAAAFDCALRISFEGWEEIISTLVCSAHRDAKRKRRKP
jgi:transcriptional regulator with XRE-family HTH domain